MGEIGFRSACSRALAIAAILIMSLPALDFITPLSGVQGADPQPITVVGFIYDMGGDPIGGAEVLIKVLATNGSVRATRGFVTESDGLFISNPDFNTTDWNIGNRVEVIASWGADYGSNFTYITDVQAEILLVWLNVTYPVKLAEQTTFDIPVYVGWNFVSIPLESAQNASSLSSTRGDITAPWNLTAQSYGPGFIEGITPLSYDFPVSDNAGYWFYSNAATSITIQGRVPTATQVRQVNLPAAGGYVDFGLAGLNATRHASDIAGMWSGNGVITVVSGYNATTGSYFGYIQNISSTDFLLVPGQAYWVFIAGSGVDPVSGTFTYEP